VIGNQAVPILVGGNVTARIGSISFSGVAIGM
jgi:hypothetical protein